jgi:tetratricopeptide (TPR) repeat protein
LEVILILTWAVLNAPGAPLLDPPDTVSPDQQARALFLKAQAAYSEGDYEDAMALFEAAFKLSARPELRFNIANSAERLSRYREAADALAQYVDDAPAADRDSLRKRIARLRERAFVSDNESARNEAERAATAAEVRALKFKLSETPVPVVTAGPRGWSSLGLAVGGVLTLAAGLIVAAVANDSRWQALGRCTVGICPESTRPDFQRATQQTSIGASLVAVGAVSLGIATYLWVSRERKPSSGSAGPGVENAAVAMGIGLGGRL